MILPSGYAMVQDSNVKIGDFDFDGFVSIEDMKIFCTPNKNLSSIRWFGKTLDPILGKHLLKFQFV